MGEEESLTTERPFQSMKAVESTSAKLRTWAASCRGWRLAMAENMVGEELRVELGGGICALASFVKVGGFDRSELGCRASASSMV